MNDINEMPPKCQYCPYWEVCEYPWVCPDREQLATNLQQTCNQLATDTISRQDAIDAVSDCGICIQRIVDLPSAQPERRHGYWIESREHVYMCNEVKEWTNWYCSECDAPNSWPTDFCPYCGVDMREEQNDG